MNIQVGVKALICRDDKYLFLRRALTFRDGTQEWDIPGGRIEPAEALHVALAREVLEETGLVLDDTEVLLTAQDIFVPDSDVHVVRLTYRATATGTVVISDEHDGYKWMTRHEVLAEPYVDSYVRKVLETL